MPGTFVPAVIEDVTIEQVTANVQAFDIQYKYDLPSPYNLHAELHYRIRTIKDVRRSYEKSRSVLVAWKHIIIRFKMTEDHITGLAMLHIHCGAE